MYTLQQLAEILGGQVIGDRAVVITGVGPFEQARPGDITLALDTKYRDHLEQTQASAIIVAPGVTAVAKPVLQVNNPKLAFARTLTLFHPQRFEAHGISPLAFVGRDCRIASEVSIYPFVFIGNGVQIEDRVTLYPGVVIGDGCQIGTGCILYPNVTLYAGVKLGQRVILHSGSVIGADGFGYVFDGQTQVKIPQTGSVEIHDDVEIGANTTVDRATFGATVIERSVKLDNLVQIGHNCRIGENTIIVGCVGVGGSVTIGKNCVLAGQAGVADHVKIGDKVTVLGRAGVSKDIPAGKTVFGQPARDYREEFKTQALVRQLPRLYQQWQELKSQLDKKEGEEYPGQGF